MYLPSSLAKKMCKLSISTLASIIEKFYIDKSMFESVNQYIKTINVSMIHSVVMSQAIAGWFNFTFSTTTGIFKSVVTKITIKKKHNKTLRKEIHDI